MSEVRIGVIGTGVMGTDHARKLAGGIPGARLTAVQDFDAARASALSRELDVIALAQADDLIAHPEVDAVLVCSPDGTHAALGLKAIAAGKPVMIEKPLAAERTEAEAILHAEMAAGRRLVQVGYMRRFDPGYAEMRRVVANGEIGAPLFLHCQHRNESSPSYLTSDLIIASSAGHEFDAARFVLGEEIASATVISPPEPRHAPGRKPQFIVLQSASGAVVDIEVYTDARYGYDVQAELVCETGTLSLRPGPPTSLRHAARDGLVVPGDWRARFADAYRLQFEAWILSILTGRTNEGSTAWDGYMTMLVTDACLKAWRSGARVEVEQPDRPAFYR
ncbi:Gfo/Idh/MocA family oxidoreductase [Acidisoma cellulosilytica]|uniref:Gfo/Idh/MocA family oxidoreductase n=1 Tax=Acidisoma cellulosilyticum TaxID=2802395 RepID=A0A963Z402_9PROT|nr:Gfo/Idh/MocA family oxidoreductase [Acidisoma cellulosilyticum]MCB8882475.1 Gfo/Idh/MocA family oxidoreductase [Acidisoma cellulosilyticum]